jgi:hypothetical protein
VSGHRLFQRANDLNQQRGQTPLQKHAMLIPRPLDLLVVHSSYLFWVNHIISYVFRRKVFNCICF